MKADFLKIKLLYITDTDPNVSLEKQVEESCKGGVKYVQLRLKDCNNNEFFDKAKKVKKICEYYGVLFIINDNVDIALQVDADGVHLGKDDCNIEKARQILGKNKIIGATCNNFEDIVINSAKSVDYIGLGPYSFTDTKKNIAPIIGINGYKLIVDKMKENDIFIPIYAVGGIKKGDIIPLIKLGLNGVAISSHIKNSVNIEQETKIILKLIDNEIINNS